MSTPPEVEPTPAELEKLAAPFHKQARAMLAHLKAEDVSPAARRVLESIVGTLLMTQHGLDIGRETREALARRLATLERRRVMEFTGPHDPGREYRQGEVVQRASATWVCLVATTEPPGASPAWRRISGST